MSFSYDFDWAVLLQKESLLLLLQGAQYTLLIFVVSTLLSTFLGIVWAVVRLSPVKSVRYAGAAWVSMIRHVPAVFLILFVYFALPEMLPHSWASTLHQWTYYALAAGIAALSLDNSAYVSDIVRNGVLSIPQGEREAAQCCGLTRYQQWRCCLLPQTVRRVLPPLLNRTVHNFKNSSLCVAIAVPELMWATQQIESLTFRTLEVTLVATAFYLVGAWSLSQGISMLETRWLRPRSIGRVALAPVHEGAR